MFSKMIARASKGEASYIKNTRLSLPVHDLNTVGDIAVVSSQFMGNLARKAMLEKAKFKVNRRIVTVVLRGALAA